MHAGTGGGVKGVSQFCERFSRLCAKPALAILALVLAITAGGGAHAAPEDDFRNGSQAYRTGDVVGAMALLRRAATSGHAPSQVLLASILDQAEFDEEAIAWYRKAAEQGDAGGEFGLGSMYLAGEGVKQDSAQAYFWFIRAADRKYERAIIALANASIRAENGEIALAPDKSRAGEWLHKAAEAKYLPAIEALARAYRAGTFGVRVDGAKADQYAAMAEAMRKAASADKGKKKR